jgi:hypothetical protein
MSHQDTEFNSRTKDSIDDLKKKKEKKAKWYSEMVASKEFCAEALQAQKTDIEDLEERIR